MLQNVKEQDGPKERYEKTPPPLQTQKVLGRGTQLIFSDFFEVLLDFADFFFIFFFKNILCYMGQLSER